MIAISFQYNGVFTPEQDNDKTNVEPVHSYDAFHTILAGPGVNGIIGMHRFNICVVVLSLSCSGVKTTFKCYGTMQFCARSNSPFD